MSQQQRLEWATTIFEQMKKRIDLTKINRDYFHVGRRYREDLIPKLELIGVQCAVPLEELSFGKQITWYTQNN